MPKDGECMGFQPQFGEGEGGGGGGEGGYDAFLKNVLEGAFTGEDSSSEGEDSGEDDEGLEGLQERFFLVTEMFVTMIIEKFRAIAK